MSCDLSSSFPELEGKLLCVVFYIIQLYERRKEALKSPNTLPQITQLLRVEQNWIWFIGHKPSIPTQQYFQALSNRRCAQVLALYIE